MASTSTATRLHSEVFLIGLMALDPLHTTLKQLPTVKQVLQRFHYHLREMRTIRNASHMTIEEVVHLWFKANIPTRLIKHAIEKLEKIHGKWLLLKKNKIRSSPAQRNRELLFKNELDGLFDIAHADALILIKIKEDRDFLIDQRNGRNMYLGKEDREFIKKQERILKRKKQEEERKEKVSGVNTSTTFVNSMTDSENSESTSQSDVDEDFLYSETKTIIHNEEKKQHLSKTQLFTSHVTGALDRNKTSDREAVRLIVPIVSALGHDPCALPLSRSTIQRSRKKARKEYAESVIRDFKPDCPLVLHWDGKLLPECFGLGNVDRLPVFVSGVGIEKLLGVPKLNGVEQLKM